MPGRLTAGGHCAEYVGSGRPRESTAAGRTTPANGSGCSGRWRVFGQAPLGAPTVFVSKPVSRKTVPPLLFAALVALHELSMIEPPCTMRVFVLEMAARSQYGWTAMSAHARFVGCAPATPRAVTGLNAASAGTRLVST